MLLFTPIIILTNYFLYYKNSNKNYPLRAHYGTIKTEDKTCENLMAETISFMATIAITYAALEANSILITFSKMTVNNHTKKRLKSRI